jgi:hypothetical protein
MAESVRYSDTLTIRCQPELVAWTENTAFARGQKPSELVRQLLLQGARAYGFDPAAVQPHHHTAKEQS